MDCTMDEEGEDDPPNLEDIVRDLGNETVMEISSPLKKRSRNKEDSRSWAMSKAVMTAALRQSSFIPHNYSNPRVIVEGLAKLTSDDKAAQCSIYRTSGHIVGKWKNGGPLFRLNPTIIGGGRKDLRDAKDVPLNMTAMWNYVKILEKSMQTFQPKSNYSGAGKKGEAGNYSQYADKVYFTMVWSCNVNPRNLITGIMVEWMRAGGSGLYRKEIQAIETYSPFVILKLSIYVGVLTLVAEFRKIMEEAI
jgi:hypothetical protein